MKRIALVVTVLVIIAASAYIYIQKDFFKGKVDLWEKIPDNAVLVFESRNLVDRWNHLLETPIWESFNEIEEFHNIKSRLELLDSIGGHDGKLDKLIKNSSSLISLHVTGKNSFDYTYYIDLTTKESQKIASEIVSGFEADESVISSSRIYQGLKLSELKKGTETFTYLIDNNVFIGSFTPFLVEDVVRLMNGDVNYNFITMNKELTKMPKLAKDDGNVYISIPNFAQFINIFQASNAKGQVKKLNHFGKSSFLDVSVDDDKILFNGFSNSSPEDFLTTFQNQEPSSSNIKYFVSNQTTKFLQYTLSDPSEWHSKVQEYWEKYDAQFLTQRAKFEKENDFQFADLYQWLGSEVAIASLQSFSNSESSELVYVKFKDENEALKDLNKFAETLAKVNNDTVYTEQFSLYNIKELDVSEFPQYAFGPAFKGFDECFFSFIDDYIVFGSNIQAIKSLITDIENENTWGRSVSFNKFIDSNLEESNINFVFSTVTGWNDMLVGLESSWKEFAENNSYVIKGFRLGSLQFSRLDDSFYTSLAMSFEKQEHIAQSQYVEALLAVNHSEPIISKPFVVKNHVSNTLETLIQDSSYDISLISTEGKVLWSDSIGEPIVSDVEQVDYYKNGKLQYFFATSHGLHIIDRLGNYIEGYPVRTQGDNIQYASVVDYDKSLRYRFLVATERGDLFLYNKEGVTLEGWTPRKITGKLGVKPFHLRVRGRDCIVAIQQDGVVSVLNRRGEMMKGFPLQINSKMETQPFIQYGSDFSKTIVSTLSNDGKLIQFNLEGKVMRTDQLYQPSRETVFQLVPDALGKDYLISRQDMGRVTLLDADRKEVLSKDYLSSGKLIIQYYNFSLDNKIYVITDEQQGFTYIYDQAGELVNAQPLDSEHEIATLFFENTKKYHVYSVSGNSFKISEF